MQPWQQSDGCDHDRDAVDREFLRPRTEQPHDRAHDEECGRLRKDEEGVRQHGWRQRQREPDERRTFERRPPCEREHQEPDAGRGQHHERQADERVCEETTRLADSRQHGARHELRQPGRRRIDRQDQHGQPDVVRRKGAARARDACVRSGLERVRAEPAPVALPVVVADVEVAIGEETLGDHQIVRLVSRVGKLAMRRERPHEEDEHDGNGLRKRIRAAHG